MNIHQDGWMDGWMDGEFSGGVKGGRLVGGTREDIRGKKR